MSYDYATLQCRFDAGVLWVTIDNPPVNLMNAPLASDLIGLSLEAEADDAVRVVVLQSADPEFFIAHYDVEAILSVPTEGPATRASERNPLHAMFDRFRTMPKATIAKIRGRAGGGGNELAAGCDMRFGVLGETRFNQMEVPLGIIPGAGGTQLLPRLVGRGRSMEICLGGDDLDAATAEAWGYLNRAFEDAATMDAFVDRLAHRIAGWPADAIRLCKASINAADMPLEDGLREEAYLFQQTLRTEGAQKNMKKALAEGAQTRDGELEIDKLSGRLANTD